MSLTLLPQEAFEQHKWIVQAQVYLLRGRKELRLEDEDLLQEGYMALWVAVKQFGYKGAQFTTFARAVVRKHLIMQLRTAKRRNVAASNYDALNNHVDASTPNDFDIEEIRSAMSAEDFNIFIEHALRTGVLGRDTLGRYKRIKNKLRRRLTRASAS